MSFFERRKNRRLVFSGESPFSLEMTLEAEPIRCSVLDLSTQGLRILLPPEAPALAAGVWLGNLVLHAPVGTPSHLRIMTVEECASDQAGRRFVRLTTSDEQARAGLWLSLDRHISGIGISEESETGSRQGLRPIPKRGIYTEAARLERLDFIRAETGAPLHALQESRLRADRLTGNIENLIGSVEIPVGIAGPLLFRGEQARGVFHLPMATTEGALVASTTRGSLAVTRSGGVSTRVVRRQMTRVPVFVFADMVSAHRFANWVRDHVEEIREHAIRVSRHARLIQVDSALRGNMVTVSFLYETGDAAGQNMTTSCTWHACQWLLRQLQYLDEIRLVDYFIESGLSGDKKVSSQGFVSGRGTRVTAECHLRRRVVEEILKVTPEELARGAELASTFGVQAGTVGWNINIANVIAAVFTATGQDIACVHESSVGVLYIQAVEDGIYASLILPSLVLGTVGGGTHLPRQREILEMMGCAGPGRVARLAEIVAGFCLALDLSTLAAIAGGQFASAHERLGRNRPVRWFTRADLTPAFFTPGIRCVTGGDGAEVLAVEFLETRDTGSSVLTELTARRIEKLIGLLPVRLTYAGPDRVARTVDVMVKIKPLDREVLLMTHQLASMCGPRLAASLERFKDRIGIAGCHVRELEIYRQSDPRFLRHTPAVYEIHLDEAREAYVLVLEQLEGFELLDSADDPSGWRQEHLDAAVRGIADVHAIWYGREVEARKQPWLGWVPNAKCMTELRELWEDLAVHASEEFPEWFTLEDLASHRRMIEGIPDWWPRLEAMPRTIVHNDFNPRNLAFRRDETGPRLVAYDWELATLHVPQRDLAELLCYVLSPRTNRAEVDRWVALHREALAAASEREIPEEEWREGFRLSLYDLAVNRIGFYLAAHTFRHYAFLERVVRTLHHLIHLEETRPEPSAK